MYGPERDNIVGYILGRPLKNRPGSKFTYNSGLSALLGVILEKRTGSKFTEFTDQYLFGPLGITKYIWGYVDSAAKVPRTGGGLNLRPRDMAKLGQLFLNKGQWKGRQIISSVWIEEATRIYIKRHPKSIVGYGYQWWCITIKHKNEIIDAFAAMGWGGQRILVFPALDMVVVSTAGNYSVPHVQAFGMIYV